MLPILVIVFNVHLYIKHAISVHCYGWLLSVLVCIIINHSNTVSHRNAIRYCLHRKHTWFNYIWKIRSERINRLLIYWQTSACVWLTHGGRGCKPSRVITPSFSISICRNVSTFCRISSSEYLQKYNKKYNSLINKTHYLRNHSYLEWLSPDGQ